MPFVYLIKNLANGKIYIGKTSKTVNRRWQGHLSYVNLGSQDYLHRAIRKYGKESFSVTTIYESPSSLETTEAEIRLIKEHRSNDPKVGYNQTPGGEGKGGPLSLETKEKIRKAKLGKPLSNAHKEAISKGKIGIKLSETHRSNIGRSRRSKPSCKNGHLYTGDNLRIGKGRRCCRQCERLRSRNRKKINSE